MLKRIAFVFALAVSLCAIGNIHFSVSPGSAPAIAATLPAGCYTDTSGLAVCGPNYAGPGGSPYPTPTGSSANANCSFAGLVITCTTPTPLPSPTSANANCSFSGVTLTCTTPGPTNPGSGYLAALVTLGFKHAWTGASPAASPTACASSQPVTDAIANGGAQNLTGINSTTIVCGTQPIIKDGTSTSFFLCSDQGTNPCGGGSVHDYFSVPSAALPVSTALTECSAVRDSGGPFNNAGGTLFSYDNADRIEFYTQGATYGTADIRSNGSQTSVFRMDHAPHLICVVSNGTNVITYIDGMASLLTTNNPSSGPGGAGGWGTQVVSGPTLNCNCYVQWLSVGPAMTNNQMLWLFLNSGL